MARPNNVRGNFSCLWPWIVCMEKEKQAASFSPTLLIGSEWHWLTGLNTVALTFPHVFITWTTKAKVNFFTLKESSWCFLSQYFFLQQEEMDVRQWTNVKWQYWLVASYVSFYDLLNEWLEQVKLKHIESLFGHRTLDFKILYVVHITF